MKIINTLGLDDWELEEAEKEEYERQEERIKKARMNIDLMNKKKSKKALTILGHDPSQRKLENTLGVDNQTLRYMLSNKNTVSTWPSSASPILLVSFVFILFSLLYPIPQYHFLIDQWLMSK